MANLNLNKVILGGRISTDLELKQTTSGTSVITFSIAVNRRGTKQGEQQQADFIEVKAWKQTAEFVSRYFRKGSSICIVGELKTDSWVDQQTNQKRYKTYVNANEAMFVDSKNDGDGADQGGYNSYAPTAPAPNFEDIKEDEDLPF